jgi:hypothetical protein
MLDREDLKSEAASLGVTHNANISAEKLKAKIDAHYESQETSGPELAALVEKVTENETEVKTAPTKNDKMLDPKVIKRMAREKEARKTRIISIVDNDQRINNHATTCVVNCANQFFDLGTRILPLGEKLEVAQGHINVLKEVRISLHTRDTKTGLNVTKSRARYSISYEDVE